MRPHSFTPIERCVGASAPAWRAILARLAEGEATVDELAALFPTSQPAISRHLEVLAEAGVIVRRVEGTKRPSRLAPGGLSGHETVRTHV